MVDLEKKYKDYWTNKYSIRSSIFGLLFLIFSLAVNYWAVIYATKKESNFVTDIILSNIRAYNFADIFAYGFLALIIFIVFITLAKPERIPFVTKTTAIFILIRSIFICLTHIRPYPDIILTNNSAIDSITASGDVFFSGHAGLPFLMALIFWQEKKLRYFFILMSVVFGIIALLGHYHYTIDVLSAFFITFGIYHICLKIFKKDLPISLNGV